MSAMYICRPRPARRRHGPAARPRPAPRGPGGHHARASVSLLTDVSSESVSAILPLYLTAVVGLSTGRVRLRRRPLPGRQRAGPHRRRLGGRRDRPPQVGRLPRLRRCRPWRASSCSSPPGAAGDRRRRHRRPDRQGHQDRTPRRDDRSATPTEHLGRAFGVHRMLDTVGAAIGPLIAFGSCCAACPDGYSDGAGGLAGLRPRRRGPPRPARPRRPRPARPRSGAADRTPPPFRWRDLTDRAPAAAARGRRGARAC